MDTKDFQIELKAKVDRAEHILKKYLPAEEGVQKTVLEAMNYSLLAGGKRLRPIFMQEVYSLFGGNSTVIEPFMAAMEMIHTYSLVHDDLPAMDNDDYRRGRLTTWNMYGEAMGILAGDGLLNYAFETALKAFEEEMEPSGEKNAIPADEKLQRMQSVARALQVLAEKAGVYGMIGGQTADIESEQSEEMGMDTLMFIHEKKTAALIQASMMIGAILAGASQHEIEEIEKCAYNIGIAFQIEDDILDVIGNSEELGKPVGSDEENHKLTYVSLRGLEQAKEDAEKLTGEAVGILRNVGGEGSFLEQLILSLLSRRK